MIRCVSLVAGYVESASPKPFIIFYNGSAVFETKNEALRSLAEAFYLKHYSGLEWYYKHRSSENLFEVFINYLYESLTARTNDEYGNLLSCGWDDMVSLEQILEQKLNLNELVSVEENAEYEIAKALNFEDIGDTNSISKDLVKRLEKDKEEFLSQK